MKIKRLFSGIGLGLFAFAAVGAGLVGAKANKAEPIKADGEKWMVTICFDNEIPETSELWGYIENRKVNFWGTNVSYDTSVREFHSTGRDFFYTVNVSFESTQSVSGMQINFTENGVKKQSQDIVIALDSTCNGRVYTFGFPEDVSWTDGKWSVANHGYQTPTAKFGLDDESKVTKTFLPDPESESYYIRDLVVDISENACYANFNPFCSALHGWNDTEPAIRRDADYYDQYFYGWNGPSWLEFKVSGTFDLFLTNEFKESGVIDVKKHEDVSTDYIYYVLENNTPTNDYIYTWGGSEQFGSWPGTKITEVAGVQEVTGNGVLHFQGSETPKLIYRIPIQKGYPVGDSHFKFNNNDTMETNPRPINNNNAYWWDGDANGLAGSAIKFLVEAEAIRNSAEDYSVCNISKEDATSIVYSYISLGASMQETYIDCTTVYTHKRDGSSGSELVSYRLVIEQLAKIADLEEELGISPSPELFAIDANNSNLVLIISLVAFASVSSLSLLVVLKKRKHN